MANTAIAIDRLQAFQVALKFTAKITFDEKAATTDNVNDGSELLRTEVFGADVRIDLSLFEYAFRGLRPDSVNVWERRFDAFFSGNVNSK